MENQRTPQPDLEMGLRLLEEHASKIPPMKALEILPDSVPIGRIKHFLEVSLQNNLTARRRTQVLKGLLYAEHLQVQEQRMHYESQNVLMTEFNICPVCKKRFGNQRFVLQNFSWYLYYVLLILYIIGSVYRVYCIHIILIIN